MHYSEIEFVITLNTCNTFYVFTVLFGEPFCSSARRAFTCLTSDSSKAALIIGVGTFIITAIELIITTTVTFIGMAIFMVIIFLLISELKMFLKKCLATSLHNVKGIF